MTPDPALDDGEAEIIDLPTGQRRFSDSQVRRIAEIFASSSVLAQVTAWETGDRKSPSGRPAYLSFYPLIVAMALASISNQPCLCTTYADILYFQISPAMRALLEIPEPKNPYTPGSMAGKSTQDKALYQRVRRRFEKMVRLMDPSPRPKNRRLADEVFQRAMATRQEQVGHEGLALRYDRLRWFINAIIEESLNLLPRAVRRQWKGSVAVDATPVPAFARPSRPRRGIPWKKGTPPEVHSADPDAAMYRRTPKSRLDDEDEITSGGTTVFAYEATIVVMGPDDPGNGDVLPRLVVAMAPLHQPSSEAGLQAVRALQNLVEERGHPAKFLAADRAYTDSRAENFALPVRGLGYSAVLDYAGDHLGVQGEVQGFEFIEGCFYCPAMPEALKNANQDFDKKIIDEATRNTRLELRWRHRAVRKQRDDADGYGRWMCPALGPNAKIACPLRPDSLHHDGRIALPVEPPPSLRAVPPQCCTKGSVTIKPRAGTIAKLRQDLLYRSYRWEALYHGLRSPIEGMNGYLKDGAYEALADSQRRRVRGTAAQSVFVAFLIFAANIRKIGVFGRSHPENGQVATPRRRSRRRHETLNDWRPEPSRVSHPPDPPLSA